MTWLAPRDAASRPLVSVAARRAAIESALASWTYGRHAGQPLVPAKPSRAAHAARELQVSGAALPAFVEAAPEVIARLVATLGQMKRGLGAIGGLPATSPAMVTLAEVDDILRVAMRVATRTANDEALAAEDLAALASLPARFARLEEPGEDGVAPMVPVVAEVFVDAAGHRVLSTATGPIEPAVMIVREPGTGRLVMAVGAHVAHHELVEARGQRRPPTMTAAGRRARGPPRARRVHGGLSRRAVTRREVAWRVTWDPVSDRHEVTHERRAGARGVVTARVLRQRVLARRRLGSCRA